ncbi:hypothetical protein G9E11_17640 [Arthrobacter sp. IA7]|uniref:hypothetical protein n=1 Tax=Arthrobacter ipis TaxID=2716202 RepID=UPI001683746F|nr:hypothetical protein [Arthrobacter ipis]MBD1544025.1 hypothetical protein [Arthrobacter ipis]
MNAMLTLANPSLEKLSTTLLPAPLAAVTGLAAAAVLFVNAAKRAELIPVSSATQLAAPLAQAFAIILVVGLGRVALRRSSKFSSVALALNVVGLSAATGAEWVINLVFIRLDPFQIAALRGGPLGTALLAGSIVFLLGSILYCLALLRDGNAPRIPTIAYAIATIPIALRSLVPELALDAALALLGASVIWLALWMLKSRPA